MADYFSSLLRQANIGQSRSAITNPLQWAMVILICGTALMWMAHVPMWVICLPAIGFALVLLLFLGAYIFFMTTNSDALRSESYSLSKMAIERGMVGDSLHGLFETTPLAPRNESLLLPTETADDQEIEQ